ncbi:PREDICTED: protein D3-like [Rhagoletis zephyria]|uniref:protein D3-like n=1 Tax=Rhagoletis zephyria TaxID=28612 RepID=UPI00081122CF|nr:PREDICTED: protein D3-like [Rhagoletis zephyria]XP_036341043.1 protein D3-like [Rhagoletis pomonella]
MTETLEQLMENVPSVEVVYSSGVKVERGNELTPTQVKDKPTTVSWPAEDGAFYTLLFLCPDAPSRTDRRCADTWHWLVVNIPGSNIAEGHTVADYIGAAPGDGAGFNRYIYAVFKQQGKAEDDQLQSDMPLEKRAKRNTKEIVEKYNLGKPIAISYFEAKFDDYVPELLARLPKLE